MENDPLVDLAWLPAALEALLMMVTEPIPARELAEAVRVPLPEVERQLEELRQFYEDSGRGFELLRVGVGWRYYAREEHSELIHRWVLEGQQGKLSQAALETLSVVAYMQPISRSQVAAVRGVNVDGVIRTLVARDMIEVTGQDMNTGARMFATTETFLERMGITSLDDLPPIAPYLPNAIALETELAEMIGLRPPAPLTEEELYAATGKRSIEQGESANSAESAAESAQADD
ncbi:MAG: SMC-Scp complex subunit ScpB [Propionibacteriaceae bacterium]|jgi:segregation and condensation protein B|nr:SMC-Scp complex subunit ScpB [Propionibacteriaceae bacterium]